MRDVTKQFKTSQKRRTVSDFSRDEEAGMVIVEHTGRQIGGEWDDDGGETQTGVRFMRDVEPEGLISLGEFEDLTGDEF